MEPRMLARAPNDGAAMDKTPWGGQASGLQAQASRSSWQHLKPSRDCRHLGHTLGPTARPPSSAQAPRNSRISANPQGLKTSLPPPACTRAPHLLHGHHAGQHRRPVHAGRHVDDHLAAAAHGGRQNKRLGRLCGYGHQFALGILHDRGGRGQPAGAARLYVTRGSTNRVGARTWPLGPLHGSRRKGRQAEQAGPDARAGKCTGAAPPGSGHFKGSAGT